MNSQRSPTCRRKLSRRRGLRGTSPPRQNWARLLSRSFRSPCISFVISGRQTAPNRALRPFAPRIFAASRTFPETLSTFGLTNWFGGLGITAWIGMDKALLGFACVLLLAIDLLCRDWLWL